MNKCNWKYNWRCQFCNDPLSTCECVSKEECEHRVTIPDAPANEPVVYVWRHPSTGVCCKAPMPFSGTGLWVRGTAAEYEAAKQPAPEVPTVGEPVNPIEPLSLLAGTGIVEVIRKINEIIERLNAKGGV